jgi:hypothetical protein
MKQITRMRSWSVFLFAAAAVAQTPAALQQTGGRPTPTGVVTGRVYCSDTNEPARFAHVYLEPVPQEPKLGSTDATQVNADAGTPRPTAQRSDTVMTTLDGSFTLGNIAAGAYYVVVQEPGYINAMTLFTPDQLRSPTQEIRDQLAQKLTRVVAEANQTETVAIRIERGGAITGTILYDDGSPAGGVFVKLLQKNRRGEWFDAPGPTSAIETDDRGRYRIGSLIPNEYMVKATLQLADSKVVHSQFGSNTIEFQQQTYRSSLSFFGAGTARLDSANSVHIGNGQERAGQDMTIPISRLRQLTGRVLAGADSHPVNAANVSVLYADNGKVIATSDISREDGLFHFEFVPDGDYTLHVSEARDVVWEPAPPGAQDGPFPARDKERVVAKYGGADQSLLLRSDTFGFIMTVPTTPTQ